MDIDVEVHPGIHALFWHYNTLYFDDALQKCKNVSDDFYPFVFFKPLGNKSHGYHGRDFIGKMNKINSGEDEDPVGEPSIHMNQRGAERNSSYFKCSVLMDHDQSSGGSFAPHWLEMQDHDKHTKITESGAAKDNIIGVSVGETRYHDTRTKMTESSVAKDNVIGVSYGEKYSRSMIYSI
ncbi:uncharacterized protein A4U43_C06F4930 [Asparagus officinalis]|uniref:Uncharacterized protein n=1 Tax=Asparagus officinalis TaxID=4686 RepID=A0A5P1EJM2_ASPOF|nr:uncharacterized protein A4U43_C06F4930 [Asparagus officinalis]